jgi:hypothetical protein
MRYGISPLRFAGAAVSVAAKRIPEPRQAERGAVQAETIPKASLGRARVA